MWSGRKDGNTNLFVPLLQTNSLAIDTATFMFQLNHSSSNYYWSFVEFGTPNTDITNLGTVTWLAVNNNSNYWSNKIYGYKWGSTMGDSTEYVFASKDADIWSSYSCIAGPDGQMDGIINGILSKLSTFSINSSWGYIFWCSDVAGLPSFFLNLGGYWMEVTPVNYTFTIGNSSNGNAVCTLCLKSYSTIDYWVLGNAFMRGWYIIFDYNNN